MSTKSKTTPEWTPWYWGVTCLKTPTVALHAGITALGHAPPADRPRTAPPPKTLYRLTLSDSRPNPEPSIRHEDLGRDLDALKKTAVQWITAAYNNRPS